MNETPILRVLAGTNPGATAAGQLDAPEYVHIQLRWDAARNEFASGEAGRPVFDRILMLRHIYPGTPDMLDVPVKRYPDDGGKPVVLDQARLDRFGEVIRRFEANAEAMASGTPLATMNLDPAQIATLLASGIGSVEALADVADTHLDRLGMGARAMRDRAKAYFDALEGNAPMEAMRAENSSLRRDMEELRAMLAEQKAEQSAIKAEQKASRKAAGE